MLALVSIGVAVLAVARLAGCAEHATSTRPGGSSRSSGVVIAIDLAPHGRLARARPRRYGSAALRSNALHFASDFAGTLAVLGGLVAAAAGYPEGDSIAALFVAVLVLAAAGAADPPQRRRADGPRAGRRRGGRAGGDRARSSRRSSCRRLRLRQAAGRTFADVVIGVSPGAAVGQGHAAADRVEAALERALPGSDVVVHVEPAAQEAALRERVHAAALAVPRVREIHNLASSIARRRAPSSRCT